MKLPQGISVLLVACTCLIISNDSIAQQRRSVSKPAAKPDDTTPGMVYSKTMIDLRSSKLPPGYIGHNPKTIYDEMNQRQSPKGEFETTSAYSARLESGITKPIIGMLTVSDNLFAFQVGSIISEYDADSSTLLLGAKLNSVYNGVTNDKSLRAIQLGDVNQALKETYMGANGYGGKVEVEETTIVSMQLAATNWRDWVSADYVPSYARGELRLSKYATEQIISITIKMQPSLAQVSKSDIKLLVLCSLKSPYIFNGGLYRKPTFDKPRETTVLFHNLHGEMFEIWAYNTKTGEVLARARPQK